MAKLPSEMTAIEITEPGGPEVLRPTRRAVPEPGLGEVLIEVASAGKDHSRLRRCASRRAWSRRMFSAIRRM